MTKKLFLMLAGAAALCGIFGAGCAKKDTKIKIGYLVKQPEEPWFQDEWKFAQQAADKNGFELVKIGAVNGEAVQAGINNLGAQGAKGFLICAPDVRLGSMIVARAAQYNMKAMAVDDQLLGPDGKPIDMPYMGISAYDIGKMVGTALIDEMKKRGWTSADTGACAMTTPELETGRKRVQGTMDALKAAGFPMDKVYDKPNKTLDVSGARAAADIVLTQHADVNHWLVFSINDEGVMGAVRAMENRGLKADQVIGVGIGGKTAMTDFEKTSPTGVYASVLINPKRHGFEATEMVYKWITEGKEPPKTTLTTGTLITRDTYKKVMQEQGVL